MAKAYHNTAMRKTFYNEMIKVIDGRCMICGQPERLVVDLNHDTGEFRGLLCYACNSGLGMFKENPNFLLKAVRYLKEKGAYRVGTTNRYTLKRNLNKMEWRAVASSLIDNLDFTSDRARARELANRLNISVSAAQARICRLRQETRREASVPQG